MKDREILQGGLLGFLALISSLPRSYGMVWSAVLFFVITFSLFLVLRLRFWARPLPKCRHVAHDSRNSRISRFFGRLYHFSPPPLFPFFFLLRRCFLLGISRYVRVFSWFRFVSLRLFACMHACIPSIIFSGYCVCGA